MKSGVVKLSTTKKYNRLDPEFYLGDPEEKRGLISSRQRIKSAKREYWPFLVGLRDCV